MDSPEIQGLSDAAAMQKIIAMNQGSEYNPQQVRHPVTMDDLRALKPKIEELQKKGEVLQDWTVVGPEVVVANFEGNVVNGKRERHQPWWDIGYTIDIFYLTAFFLGVVLVVKRLPPYTWQPS
jgi:hypothetical protein